MSSSKVRNMYYTNPKYSSDGLLLTHLELSGCRMGWMAGSSWCTWRGPRKNMSKWGSHRWCVGTLIHINNLESWTWSVVDSLGKRGFWFWFWGWGRASEDGMIKDTGGTAEQDGEGLILIAIFYGLHKWRGLYILSYIPIHAVDRSHMCSALKPLGLRNAKRQLSG